MTANLLTLSSSKTELLLIRLKKQLVKIHNSSLNATHFVHNPGFISSSLPFQAKFQLSPNRAIIMFANFAVSALSFIPHQQVLLAPPSFTPNSITVISAVSDWMFAILPHMVWP